MDCPKCDSDNVNETNEFDLTVIYPEECQHDFKCGECGCLFVILYAPISANVIGQSEMLADELA